MSKSLIRKYLFITAIIIAYVVLIVFSISSNKKNLQATTYKAWYRNYVIQSIKGTYVNTGDEDHPTALSESQGYGMVITALAAQKGFASEAQFSRLFNYYKDHTISENIPLMMWKQHETSKGWISVDKNNATDGDLDIAYALILAQRLWPNSEYHYGKAAEAILNAIKKYNYNPETGLLTVGNWATPNEKQNKLLRPSDIIPTYFNTFSKFTNDDFWTQLEKRSAWAISELSDQHASGLIPDFAWVKGNQITPVKPKEISGKYDGDYSYNAARIPLRLADSKDKKVEKALNKMLTFFQKQPVIRGGYTLTGKKLVDNQSASYSAPILYATNNQKNYTGLYASQRWVFEHPLNGKDYYGDTLKTMVLLKLY